MTDTDDKPSRFLRKKQICADLQIDSPTCTRWYRAGIIPMPQLLPTISGRTIPIWDEAEWIAFRKSLPRGMPTPASPQAYQARRAQAAARRAVRQAINSSNKTINAPATVDERSPLATEPARPFLTRPK
jgi:hypothetical protein